MMTSKAKKVKAKAAPLLPGQVRLRWKKNPCHRDAGFEERWDYSGQSTLVDAWIKCGYCEIVERYRAAPSPPSVPRSLDEPPEDKALRSPAKKKGRGRRE
jgi:hypothetical protein